MAQFTSTMLNKKVPGSFNAEEQRYHNWSTSEVKSKFTKMQVQL